MLFKKFFSLVLLVQAGLTMAACPEAQWTSSDVSAYLLSRGVPQSSVDSISTLGLTGPSVLSGASPTDASLIQAGISSSISRRKVLSVTEALASESKGRCAEALPSQLQGLGAGRFPKDLGTWTSADVAAFFLGVEQSQVTASTALALGQRILKLGVDGKLLKFVSLDDVREDLDVKDEEQATKVFGIIRALCKELTPTPGSAAAAAAASNVKMDFWQFRALNRKRVDLYGAMFQLSPRMTAIYLRFADPEFFQGAFLNSPQPHAALLSHLPSSMSGPIDKFLENPPREGWTLWAWLMIAPQITVGWHLTGLFRTNWWVALALTTGLMLQGKSDFNFLFNVTPKALMRALNGSDQAKVDLGKAWLMWFPPLILCGWFGAWGAFWISYWILPNWLSQWLTSVGYVLIVVSNFCKPLVQLIGAGKAATEINEQCWSAVTQGGFQRLTGSNDGQNSNVFEASLTYIFLVLPLIFDDESLTDAILLAVAIPAVLVVFVNFFTKSKRD